MKLTILTLFPNIIEEYINTSIIKRAREKKLINIDVLNIRDYSNNKNKSVDDSCYGGGPGMVMSIQPIADAIKAIKTKNSLIINLSPSGIRLDQKIVRELALKENIILICGHYEGIDERIENYIDVSYSIGDYILTGGELPALIMVDSISRIIPGVIKDLSLDSESFNGNLLDYPVYTKPAEYDGFKVPSVLISGNHALIDHYRKEEQIKRTKKYRIDLYKKYLKERNKNGN